ncbi:hypothetical protein [Mangrovicella endophytica]|uniref:hypothetical protein n=1 Tax=Mangrovicella endophytica TaxID=2066697 RepID=UPI000C9EB666|nr:hypothetical protein [Mangrovicella endophytica]
MTKFMSIALAAALLVPSIASAETVTRIVRHHNSAGITHVRDIKVKPKVVKQHCETRRIKVRRHGRVVIKTERVCKPVSRHHHR